MHATFDGGDTATIVHRRRCVEVDSCWVRAPTKIRYCANLVRVSLPNDPCRDRPTIWQVFVKEKL
jgi:hypothetical protein